MSKYTLEYTKSFVKSLGKLLKKNATLEKRVKKTLNQLTDDPFYKGLRTHKVSTREWGVQWSSRVTGDIRVIWNIKDGKLRIIELYAIGGHSGKNRVYSKSS